MTLVSEYSVSEAVVAGVEVQCAFYKIGGTYHCVISNHSPQLNVARGSGPTQEAALTTATRAAERRFTYG